MFVIVDEAALFAYSFLKSLNYLFFAINFFFEETESSEKCSFGTDRALRR